MKLQEIILIGVKHSVSAVSKANGAVLWTTKLPSGLGGDFVTVACDGERVLPTAVTTLLPGSRSGRMLWVNELSGYGTAWRHLRSRDGIQPGSCGSSCHSSAKGSCKQRDGSDVKRPAR